MGEVTTHSGGTPPIAALVRSRVERAGERLWRLEDFRDLPFEATAQALSRLTRQGVLERLSKGVYYRARETGRLHALAKERRVPMSNIVRFALDRLFQDLDGGQLDLPLGLGL